MQKAVLARPEVLQQKVPRTFVLVPVANWFYPAGRWCEQHNTEFCPESGHAPNCIRWHAAWSDLFRTTGVYRLKTPISIKNEMPGTNHTLTYAQIEAMINTDWGTWIIDNERVFAIYADGNRMFRAEGEEIAQKENAWQTNNYPMKVDISQYSQLDVGLFSRLWCLTGAFRTHLRNVTFTVEYVPEVPPKPATIHVHVYDSQTSRPVKGAYVQILSGNKVIAPGYTGSDGWVTFYNIPGGEEGVSYTLSVLKSGYEKYLDEITVAPGEWSFAVPLVPIPTPPLPDWVKWAAIGSAVVVAGGIAMAAVSRKPAKPEVYIVK